MTWYGVRDRLLVLLLLAALFLIGWQRVSAKDALLVDEVVAVVSKHVITRSEVWEEALLTLAERRGGWEPAAEISPEFFGQVTDLLINQRVILDEAAQLGLPVVTDLEREQLLDGLRRRFRSDSEYRRFLGDNALTEEGVGDVLMRHLRVERIKEKKLKTVPEVTKEEVQHFYREHRLRFGGVKIEAVAEAIRLRLLTERRERLLLRWMWELRKRGDVKILVDLAGSPVAGEPREPREQ